VIVLCVIVVGVVLAVLVDAANQRRARELRQSGLLPPTGQGSDTDVERLVAVGRKIDAIKLYRVIHKTDLKTAKEAVDRLTERPDLRRTGSRR
jgi:ribosomal protein L7/L12